MTEPKRKPVIHDAPNDALVEQVARLNLCLGLLLGQLRGKVNGKTLDLIEKILEGKRADIQGNEQG